jgi:hypothetical protein
MRREGRNILITLAEWQEAGLSVVLYKSDRKRGYLRTANRGCNSRGVEIIWQSIVKEDRRAAIAAKFGDPGKTCAVSELEQYIRDDAAVKAFFAEYELPNGQALGGKNYDRVEEYYANAIVLEAAGRMLAARRNFRSSRGGSGDGGWAAVAAAVGRLEKYPHTLPAHERRLREKYAAYRRDGLASLIHKSFCNNYARKVGEQLERLILSVYCMGNKPYAAWVHDDYLAFIAGVLDVVDMQTGELLSRADFFDEKKGEYTTVSEATCWNYVNNPKNRAIVESLRSTRHQYVSGVRPHVHRSAPRYALSKISLDDRDLPRRMHDGNRVKAYYAYDVCSGALIGAAYSRSKDTGLFINCLRDMFRFITAGGYGVPLEVEVEHHLVSQFKDELMKAGVIFPFVRWCAAGNSQEKHAEQLNRQKKYGYEKRYQDGIGRFYARLEANKTGGERVYSEEENKYKIKEKTYSFEELVADDRAMVEAYNNGPHRDRQAFAGKSRLEALRENINPNLAPVNRAALARYIGECTETSIQRNMYCRVQYADYMLPSPELLKRLQPNNYTVQAYCLPEAGGADSVFIYQNGELIAECGRIKAFTTAQAERTEADTAAMTEQMKYIAQFDKMVKEGKNGLLKAKTIRDIKRYEAVTAEEVAPQAVEAAAVEAGFGAYSYDEDYQRVLALESL